MSRRKIVVIGLAVLAVCTTFAVALWPGTSRPGGSIQKANALIPMKSVSVGLNVLRHSDLKPAQVNAKSRSAGQLWALTGPSDGPELSLTAYFEQGASLRKLTATTRQPLREVVLGNVSRQLPKQYPSYKQISQNNRTIHGVDATDTIFEYSSGTTIVRQRLMLLFKNSDTVVYIRAQARASDFSAVNARYFKTLFSSANFE